MTSITSALGSLGSGRLSVGAAVLVAALAVAACGGDASPPTPAAPRPTPARPTGLVDDLVPVDGGTLHLHCEGAGDSTVLLLAGWGSGREAWRAVEPTLAAATRVCSYDRFGTGTSSPPPATQTFATQAAALDELLERAGEPGPYVVVGHSFGGAEAVAFASTHPSAVTGVLLVDATPATWPDVVCAVPEYAGGCAVMRDSSLDPERVDVFPAFAEVGAITSLGDVPLSVLSAAVTPRPELPAETSARLDQLWQDGMSAWAALSSASTLVPVPDTGHDIQLEQPQRVVDELRALLDS